MTRTINNAATVLASAAWDRLSQENPDHEVDKDAVVAAIENNLIVDMDQMRHEVAVRAVEMVDRKRTTPRNGWKEQLTLPGIPEDEFLVIGEGRRVQRVAAKLKHAITTIRLRWDNVQKVTDEAQSVQSYYSELMEDLAKGRVEGEALLLYQLRNGIGFDEDDTARSS